MVCHTHEGDSGVIEIMGLHPDDDDKRTWRVTWPNPDESKSSTEFETCELAVEYALLIRVTMHINEGVRRDVVVVDEFEKAPPWGKRGHNSP